MRPDGFLVGLLITGNASQGYHYLQFVARSDGKDYPEYSDQIVGDLVAAGKPTRRSYAETVIDEYVTEWIDKVDGRVTGQGKKIGLHRSPDVDDHRRRLATGTHLRSAVTTTE